MADAAGLGALGEAALRADDLELAYAVSAAGLKLAQERWAEFLFLRARALPDWEEERQALCAAAASELARRQRNADLLRRIGEWREEEMLWLDGDKTDVAMTISSSRHSAILRNRSGFRWRRASSDAAAAHRV